MKNFYLSLILFCFSNSAFAATFVTVESTEITANGEFRVVALSDTVFGDEVIGQYRYDDGMGGFIFSGFQMFTFLEDAGGGNFRFELTFTVPMGINTVDVEVCNENAGFVFNCTGFVETVTGLPVELGAFTAEVKSGEVALKWRTLSEENVSHFDIQRSTNGIDFESVYEVSAAGNSTTALTYEFSDAILVPGEIFYRLHMVDMDGSSEYSKIISVDVAGQKERLLAFNPFNRALMVVSDKLCTTAGRVQVVDQSGQVVFQRGFSMDDMCGNTELYMNELSSGMYYVLVTTERGLRDSFSIMVR
ncbi:MAG: T9SS type A sorting domain-containing protein [Saprospiraceae bacterium]|nr:T9SS type A sorting domain-containing protein [Saprospiraceae bacterium]